MPNVDLWLCEKDIEDNLEILGVAYPLKKQGVISIHTQEKDKIGIAVLPAIFVDGVLGSVSKNPVLSYLRRIRDT